jgi:Protein of unknown function (DUF2462)
MAQGKHKLGKAKRSSGAKRKAVKVSKSAKKGSAHLENNKQTIETSKAINRKNERIVAAKACNAGSTNFFLKDIVDKGESFVTQMSQ